MADNIEGVDQATTPTEQANLFAQAASGQLVQPQPQTQPVATQEPVQIPAFVPWDSYKQDPQFAKLDLPQKQKLFDSWQSYATDYASKSGALNTEDDVKFTESYLSKLAKDEGLEAPQFRPPNYLQQLMEEGQSGLNSLQSGVVAYGALTGNADPNEAAKIIVKNNLADQRKYVNPNLRAYIESNPDAVSATKQMLAHPVDVMLPLFAQGIGMSLPSLAASFATGAATTALAAETGPAAPAAGLGAGLYVRAGLAGVTDALATTTQKVNEEIQKRGLNPLDPEAVASVLNDPKFKTDTLAYTAGRGVAITAADLATLGLGNFLGHAAEAGAMGAVKQFGKQVGTQIVAQPVSEVSAQALGQLAEGKPNIELSGRQIAERTLAGLPGNVIEGGVMTAKILMENKAPASANAVVQNAVADAAQGNFAKLLGEPTTPQTVETFFNTLPEESKVQALGLPTGTKLTPEQSLFGSLNAEQQGTVTKIFDAAKEQTTIPPVLEKPTEAVPPVLEKPAEVVPPVLEKPTEAVPTPEAPKVEEPKVAIPELLTVEEAQRRAEEAFKPAPVTPEVKPETKEVLAETAPATAVEVAKTEAEAPAPAPVIEPSATTPDVKYVRNPNATQHRTDPLKEDQPVRVLKSPEEMPKDTSGLKTALIAYQKFLNKQPLGANEVSTLIAWAKKEGIKIPFFDGDTQEESSDPSWVLSEDGFTWINKTDQPTNRKLISYVPNFTKLGDKTANLGPVRYDLLPEGVTPPKMGDTTLGKLGLTPTEKVEITKAELAPAPEVGPITLPVDLRGAKPNYSYGSNQFRLKFNNDLDKTFYILAQEKPSAREADYMDFAKKATGKSEAEIRLAGKRIRAKIKDLARTSEPGVLEVPKSTFSDWRPEVAVEKPATAPVPVETKKPEPTPAPAPAPAVKKLPTTKTQVKALTKLGYLPADIEALDRTQAKDIIAKQTPKVPVEEAPKVEAKVPAPAESGLAQAQRKIREASSPLASPENEVATKPISLQEGLNDADTELQARLEKIKGQVPGLTLDEKSVADYYGGTIDPAKELEVRGILKVLDLGLGNVKQILATAKGKGRQLERTFTGIKKIVFTKRQRGGSGLYADPSDAWNLDTLFVNPDQLLRSFKSEGALDPANFFVSALMEEVIHANHGLAMAKTFADTNPPEKTPEAYRKFYDAQNKEIEDSLSVDQIKTVLQRYAKSLGVDMEGKTKEQILEEFNKDRPGRLAEEYLRALIQEKVLGHITEDQVKAVTTNPILRSLAAIKNFFVNLVGKGTKQKNSKKEIDRQQDAIISILGSYSEAERNNIAKEPNTTIPGRVLASSTDPFAEAERISANVDLQKNIDDLGPNGRYPKWREILGSSLRNRFSALKEDQINTILNDSVLEAVRTFDESKGAKLSSWIYTIAYKKALSEKIKLDAKKGQTVSLDTATLVDLNQERSLLNEGKKSFETNSDNDIPAEGPVTPMVEEGVLVEPSEKAKSLEALTATKETPATKALSEEKIGLTEKLTERFLQPVDQDIIKYIKGDPDALTRAQISEQYGLSNDAFTKRRNDILSRMRDILGTKEFGAVKSYRELASSVEPRVSKALEKYKQNLSEERRGKMPEFTYVPDTNEAVLKKANDYVNSFGTDPMNAYYAVKSKGKTEPFENAKVVLGVILDRLEKSVAQVEKEIKEKGSTPEAQAYLDETASNVDVVYRDLTARSSESGRDLQELKIVNNINSPQTFKDQYVKPIAKAQSELLGGKQEVSQLQKDITILRENLAEQSLEGVEKIATGGKTSVTGNTPDDILFQAILDFKDELKKDMTDRGASARSIQAKLKEKFPQFSDAQAESLSKFIASKYKQLASSKDVKAKLEKLVAPVGTRPSKPDSTEITDLVKMVNLGAFDQEKLYNILASRYELPTWDPQIAQEIIRRASSLQKLEPGSDQRLTQGNDLQAYIAQEIHKQQKGWDKFNYRLDVATALWKAGVLSGIPTQMVNISGTHMNVLLDMVEDATAYSIAAEKQTGVKVPVQDFLVDAWRGYFQMAGREGLKNAGLAFASGVTRYKNEKFQMSPLEAYKFDFSKPWKPTNYLAMWKFIGRAMSAADGYNATISAEVKARMQARYNMLVEGLSPKEAAARADLIFSQDNPALVEIRDKVNREQLDGQFGTLEGLKPNTPEYNSKRRNIEAGATRRYQQLREQYIAKEAGFTPETSESIREFARTATFNNDPQGLIGYLASNIGRTLSATKIGVPFGSFMGTVSNIVNSSLNYTPYGFLRAKGFSLGNFSGVIREGPHAFKAPEPGSVAYYKLATQAWMGTIALGTVGAMVFRDMDKPWDKAFFAVTGRGPSDTSKREQLKQTGWTENTVKIGNFTFRHTDIPALSTMFGALALMSDQRRYGNMKEEDFATLVSTAALSMGNVIFDKNLMSGVKTLFDAFSDQGNVKTKAQRLIETYATGFTNPGITRWLTQTFLIGPDGKVGKTDSKDLKSTTGGWLLSLTPFAVLADRPMLNRLGEEVREYPWAATTKRFGFVPEVKSHPVFTPLVKAGLFVPGVSANTKINAFENGKLIQRKLDATEFYDFSKFNGEYLKRSLTPSRAESLAALAAVDQNAAQKELNRLATDANDYAKNRLEIQLRTKRK